MDLSTEDFIAIRNLIYERTGMHFGENKIYYFKKRLQKRMQINRLHDVGEYIKQLKFFDRNNREFQELINLITINETYFFREFSQLEIFAEICLPEILEIKRTKGDFNLRIFSAACSSGEEPYTLAIILKEMIEDYHKWNILVKGVDIDENMIKLAQSGLYDGRAIKDVPLPYLEKYFSILSTDRFAIKPEIKDMTVFEQLNLMERRALRNERYYDFIFCRNMLIYFDEFSRKQLVEKFYTMFNKGGYIFLGHAESLSRISTAFKIRRVNGHLIYQA